MCSLALLAKGTTLAAFEAGSHLGGDEGEVWVASTAPPGNRCRRRRGRRRISDFTLFS